MQILAAKQKVSAKENPAFVFDKIFSKETLKHVKFGYFKKGLLCIYVDSSSWMFQLNLEKDKLLGQFNKHQSKIKEIKFRLGT
jgi:hypothetical protein